MDVFILILCISFGILQIIMIIKFFKMSKYIKSIFSMYQSESYNAPFDTVLRTAKRDIYAGDTKKARELLLRVKFEIDSRPNEDYNPFLGGDPEAKGFANQKQLEQIDELLEQIKN